MATTELWTDFPLCIDAETAQAGTAEYSNGRTTLAPNLVTGLMGAAGDVYNTIGYLQSGAPVASHSTEDVKEWLDECGTTGMLVNSGVSGDGVIMYFQKYAQGGTRAAGSVHWKCTIGSGIMVPRNLSLPHQGNAMLTGDIIAISADGTTSPIAYAETADLPVIYPSVDELFTIGKIDLNGTTLTGAMDVSIDFGINVLVEGADSTVYPTIATIQTIQPSITLTSREIDITSVITEAGLYYASGVIIYGRKRSAGGTYVADNTAEHLKFTMGKCRADVVNIGGGAQATIGLRITPWYTAAGSPVAPITINTASAIT